jgi:hypothetical protein
MRKPTIVLIVGLVIFLAGVLSVVTLTRPPVEEEEEYTFAINTWADYRLLVYKNDGVIINMDLHWIYWFRESFSPGDSVKIEIIRYNDEHLRSVEILHGAAIVAADYDINEENPYVFEHIFES